MTDVGKSKATLSSECYKIAIQIVCVMNVPYCTSDGYIVGMYNNDICMKYLKCGEPVLGAVIIEHVCNELSIEYTDQLYNGTDHFTYYLVEEEKETSSGTHLCNVFMIYFTIFTLPFQLFVVNYF